MLFFISYVRTYVCMCVCISNYLATLSLLLTFISFVIAPLCVWEGSGGLAFGDVHSLSVVVISISLCLFRAVDR